MGSSTSNDDEDADAVDYEKLLGKAESSAAAEAVVCEGLVQKLCRTLMIEAEAVDTAKPLHGYGVDSLVAVELCSWYAKGMGAEVAVFDIMGSGSSRGLAGVVAGNDKFFHGEATVAIPYGSKHTVHNYYVSNVIPYLK